MKKNGITFHELREFLVELGFSETPEKTRIRFAHPTTGTVLLFRPFGRKEIVPARDMLVVRRQLVDNGLIEDANFDRFLHQASA
jgi:hypothetical protein